MPPFANLSSMQQMQRSLARSILREARSIWQQQGGKSTRFQLPAIYDLCNSVNPSSGGLMLGNRQTYRSFVRTHFSEDAFRITPELGEYSGLRRLLPGILAQQKHCPFEVLRGFKHQNRMHQVSTTSEARSVTLTAVTGYASEMSSGSSGSSSSSSTNSNAAPTESGEHRIGLQRASSLSYFAKVTSGAGMPMTTSIDSNVPAQGLSPREEQSPETETESASGGGEHIFCYNVLFANEGPSAVRILGHEVVFRLDGVELLAETYQGVNNALPILNPGDHYMCGASVAFPAEIAEAAATGKGLTVGGSFEVMQDLPIGKMGFNFEELPLKKKWSLLKSCIDHGEASSFSLPMQDTKFSFDVACDTQPLIEKFGLPGSHTSHQAIAEYDGVQ